MASIIQQVAEWAHRQPGGVTCDQVAAQFGLTTTKASMIISGIHREPRFATRIEPATCIDSRGYRRTGRRLHVATVQPAKWQKMPVIGINDRGQVVQFASLTEAQDKGGFMRDSIAKCLRCPTATHAGYRWRLVN
ncbi:hypothetical protein ACV1DN_09470 [Aeromonas allosaccharophila]